MFKYFTAARIRKEKYWVSSALFFTGSILLESPVLKATAATSLIYTVLDRMNIIEADFRTDSKERKQNLQE